METTRQGVLIGGRYELGPRLRRGGFADVHAGVDRRLGREVAIKFLRPDMAERGDVRPAPPPACRIRTRSACSTRVNTTGCRTS